MNGYCGLPETLTLDAACAMPVSTIRVVLPESWNGLDFEQLKEVWTRALKVWTDVVAIKFEFVRSGDDIHIAPAWGRIDGPGNVLGWSQLPCPWNPPCTQKYDSTEEYSTQWGQTGAISLPLLIAHECGHALGMGHVGSGNVMAPYLDSRIVGLGPADREMILARYPAVSPEEPEEPDMGSFWTCLIKALPILLECLFNQEAEAKKLGKMGPLELLKRLSE